MAYYDHIARSWHESTGSQGDAFKQLVLNPLLLEKLSGIDGCSILELGAGNGYFLPLVLGRFPGQVAARITITDQSQKLLEIARRHFRIPGAEYRLLEAGQPFPFASGQFDLIIASMLFNELPARGFRRALEECFRALAPGGRCLLAVTHPDFIGSLQKRGLLKRTPRGILTMPGSGTLRLPVVIRSLASYRSCLREAGFRYEETEAYPTLELLEIKAGLRHAWKMPIALVYLCTKAAGPAGAW